MIPIAMSQVRPPSRYGMAFASTRSSTRMILSTVSTSGVDFAFSRRLSVSGRIPARRAKSVCLKPADFLRRQKSVKNALGLEVEREQWASNLAETCARPGLPKRYELRGTCVTDT